MPSLGAFVLFAFPACIPRIPVRSPFGGRIAMNLLGFAFNLLF